MPGEFLFHTSAPLCIVRSKDFLGLPEPPGIATRRAAPQVEVVEPRVAFHTDQGVLQTRVDVPGPEVGLKTGPPSHLALESVGPDDDVRPDVERIAHVLAAGADDPSILPEQRDRARLDHDLRTGLRGLPREEPIEQVSFEDVAAFVPGPGLVEDQRRAVGRDDPRTVDLVTDELPARSQPDLLEPPFRDALAAPNGCTDLGSLLNHEY